MFCKVSLPLETLWWRGTNKAAVQVLDVKCSVLQALLLLSSLDIFSFCWRRAGHTTLQTCTAPTEHVAKTVGITILSIPFVPVNSLFCRRYLLGLGFSVVGEGLVGWFGLLIFFFFPFKSTYLSKKPNKPNSFSMPSLGSHGKAAATLCYGFCYYYWLTRANKTRSFGLNVTY